MSGGTTRETNMGRIQTASPQSGGASNATGIALIAENPSSETGWALGRIGAIERPRTADEAVALAERLGGLAAAIHGFVARGERNGNQDGHAAVPTGGGTGTNAGDDGRRYDGTEIPF